jgi:hypothetical protein
VLPSVFKNEQDEQEHAMLGYFLSERAAPFIKFWGDAIAEPSLRQTSPSPAPRRHPHSLVDERRHWPLHLRQLIQSLDKSFDETLLLHFVHLGFLLRHVFALCSNLLTRTIFESVASRCPEHGDRLADLRVTISRRPSLVSLAVS